MIDDLYQAGLLQLGIFTDADDLTLIKPYRLKLELIPAYPIVLNKTVIALTAMTQSLTIERLVSTSDATPISAIVAHQIGQSLVYSRGQGERPVHDLAGAYDIGHPAALITTTLDDTITEFIAGCESTGLRIHTVMPLILEKPMSLPNIAIKPVLRLTDIMTHLYEKNHITTEHHQNILSHLTH